MAVYFLLALCARPQASGFGSQASGKNEDLGMVTPILLSYRDRQPVTVRAEHQQPAAPHSFHEAPRRRLPTTPFPTNSLMIVMVSLAASLGGKAVSAMLHTTFVMS